jgi:hypothetical protein
MNAICDKGSAVITSRYGFPARPEPDEEGRLVVHFVDLPEALSDSAPAAPMQHRCWRDCPASSGIINQKILAEV